MDKFIEHIKSKSKEELEQELKELYSSFETIRVHYNFKFNENKTKINKSKNLEKYKTKINQALNFNHSWQGGLDIEKVDKILSRLNSESNIKFYFELGLHALEECTNLANIYGGDFGEEFYNYFVELYENIVSQTWKKGLDSEYQIRIKTIMEESFEGYDYKGDLREIYNDHFPD